YPSRGRCRLLPPEEEVVMKGNRRNFKKHIREKARAFSHELFPLFPRCGTDISMQYRRTLKYIKGIVIEGYV
ncbi:MAG: hypothetical protein FWD81_05420, partial [Methanomassiliicoccaceae archaeon]|nr:hypothetical protein [Methanomassiliicoccaceae archaeon]